jgi:hypothetical protein
VEAREDEVDRRIGESEMNIYELEKQTEHSPLLVDGHFLAIKNTCPSTKCVFIAETLREGEVGDMDAVIISHKVNNFMKALEGLKLTLEWGESFTAMPKLRALIADLEEVRGK